MRLDARHCDKIDSLLQDALTHAKGDETLRAVMLLGNGQESAAETEPAPPLDPKQFASRKAYRQALIEQRQTQLSRDIDETLQGLQKLALAPRGGKTSNVVVVEGPAHRLLASLELPGVRHASLDRSIELIQPRR